mmetsp:Transcript_10953/g.50589  ORF Transcript_10953/g.50589 Transcript_10953/m.50589 type:complete len:395 (+) Transcript_10953:4454-5638(+)
MIESVLELEVCAQTRPHLVVLRVLPSRVRPSQEPHPRHQLGERVVVLRHQLEQPSLRYVHLPRLLRGLVQAAEDLNHVVHLELVVFQRDGLRQHGANDGYVVEVEPLQHHVVSRELRPSLHTRPNHHPVVVRARHRDRGLGERAGELEALVPLAPAHVEEDDGAVLVHHKVPAHEVRASPRRVEVGATTLVHVELFLEVTLQPAGTPVATRAFPRRHPNHHALSEEFLRVGAQALGHLVKVDDVADVVRAHGNHKLVWMRQRRRRRIVRRRGRRSMGPVSPPERILFGSILLVNCLLLLLRPRLLHQRGRVETPKIPTGTEPPPRWRDVRRRNDRPTSRLFHRRHHHATHRRESPILGSEGGPPRSPADASGRPGQTPGDRGHDARKHRDGRPR